MGDTHNNLVKIQNKAAIALFLSPGLKKIITKKLENNTIEVTSMCSGLGYHKRKGTSKKIPSYCYMNFDDIKKLLIGEEKNGTGNS